MELEIRPESSEDRDAIRRVNQVAFGSDVEPNLVDALRDGGFAAISLVAELDREIVGHIVFSPVAILTKAGKVDALSLAPMAVVPSHQRRGIGSRLVEQGLEVCRKHGQRIVVVLGHPHFYPRFGFSSKLVGVTLRRWRSMDGTGTCAGFTLRNRRKSRVFAALQHVRVAGQRPEP